MATTVLDITNANIDKDLVPILSDFVTRLESLEGAPVVEAQTFPDSVVENYPSGLIVTYNKV